MDDGEVAGAVDVGGAHPHSGADGESGESGSLLGAEKIKPTLSFFSN